jgi:intracellular multiplication protein IcmD
MRKLTALTVALSLSAAGQAFAGPRHAPAVHAAAAHPHATSKAGATHTPPGQALHAVETKAAKATYSGEAPGTAPTRDQVSAAGVGETVTGGSYVAGLAFAVGAVMKFKQHKDNPTQVPIGTPVTLVAIAAALLFLPSVLSVEEYTVVGTAEATDVPGVTISTE